jgi:hypothetical protein
VAGAEFTLLGTNDGNPVAGIAQRSSFLPDTAIDGQGQVLDDDENSCS